MAQCKTVVSPLIAGALEIPQPCTMLSIQRTLSRLLGSKEWYCDISESAIYQALVKSQHHVPCSSAIWAIMGFCISSHKFSMQSKSGMIFIKIQRCITKLRNTMFRPRLSPRKWPNSKPCILRRSMPARHVLSVIPPPPQKIKSHKTAIYSTVGEHFHKFRWRFKDFKDQCL